MENQQLLYNEYVGFSILQVLFDVVTMKTDCDLEEQGFVIKYVVKAEGKTKEL